MNDNNLIRIRVAINYLVIDSKGILLLDRGAQAYLFWWVVFIAFPKDFAGWKMER